jgi:imidazolonepropionase-like amidohydrolase
MKTLACLLFLSLPLLAQQTVLSPAVREYVTVDGPVALTHVRVIDGTGAAAKDDQTIMLENGLIKAVGPASSVNVPPGARVLDLAGHTVIPGLFGMHNHLFYPAGNGQYNTLTYSFPRLYLACGVTSIRTTGSMETYTDLNLKRLIDTGRAPGPKMHITGPYLEGAGSPFLQMHNLTGPDDAVRMAEYWADQGATTFKAYMHITEDELAAAAEAIHKRNLKLTGHLCSVGFRRAAELGIDDLEHGLLVDSEFAAGKKKDVCPSQQDVQAALMKLDVKGPEIQETIRTLVQKRVAVTSTLAVFEPSTPGRPPIPQRALDAMTPEAQVGYLQRRMRTEGNPNSPMKTLFAKELEFEYAFVKAGGTLLAGLDPTGGGGAIAGFGDLRDIELLVEAGFTPVEAIKIATSNGARFLNVGELVGTITAGKQADLVVIQGNPAAKITDIENVRIVFKDGVGYDSAKLIEAARGHVGIN